MNDRWEFASDEETIRDALNDFNNIVTELLTKGQPAAKSLESCAVVKAGKAMSKANRSTLQSIYTNLGEFLDKFPEEEQEETEVTKKEIEDTVAAAVAKALETQQKPATDPRPESRRTGSRARSSDRRGCWQDGRGGRQESPRPAGGA